MRMILINSATEFLNTESSAFQALSKYKSFLNRFCIITQRRGIFECYEEAGVLFINIPKITSILYVFRVAKILRREQFVDASTFVNSGDPFLLAIFGIMLGKIIRRPLLIQIHTDITSKYFRADGWINPIYYLISNFTLAKAKVISCVNSNTFKFLSTKYEDKHVELYQGLNTTNICIKPNFKITNFSNTPSLDRPATYIYPARLVKMKNHLSLINAFTKFHNIYNNASLHLYGSGEERTKITDLITKLDASKYIFIKDHQNDVSQIYTNADFLITPSLYEGFGLTVVEAISYGLPVLATPFGGALSYLDDKCSIISNGFDSNDIFDILLASQQKVFEVDPKSVLAKIDANANYNKLVNIWAKVIG